MQHRTLCDGIHRTLPKRSCCVRLVSCAWLYQWAVPFPPTNPRNSVVTVASWLPTSLRYDPDIFVALQVLFPVCALLWLAQVAIPWSSWLTAGGVHGFGRITSGATGLHRSRVCAGESGAVDMCTLVSLVCQRDSSGAGGGTVLASQAMPALGLRLSRSSGGHALLACRDRQAHRQRPRLDQRSDPSTLGNYVGYSCEFACSFDYCPP